jgi:hypothetical protein
MKEYILIKLRSGDEIVASLISKSRTGVKVLRPMQIKQVPFMDHATGVLKAAVVMENWIGRTDSNEVVIPNNWIGIKMPPSSDVIEAYERYMKSEDMPKQAPPKAEESVLTEKEEEELKRIENEMRKMLMESVGGDASSIPVEPMDNFLKSNEKGKDMVIVNFMFPSNIFKNMMEEGLIDDLLSAGMNYNDDNGDDSDEDLEDDVDHKIKPKKIRENDINLNEKGDEPYGNSFRDWSSNPSDYL